MAPEAPAPAVPIQATGAKSGSAPTAARCHVSARVAWVPDDPVADPAPTAACDHPALAHAQRQPFSQTVLHPDTGPLALVGLRGEPACFAVELAATVRRRMRGWLGRRVAPSGLGIWLLRCDAVHTFAMRFPVDLLFVDAAGRILRIDHAVRPWRLAFCVGAYSVIELGASEAARLGLTVGDHLDVRGD
jgi:uncharacterized membrane protein (UPF0127 family)